VASLYRKYRPRTFTELVGQSTVVTALSNALNTGQTVHAYLFTGPRGSGKTSSARLLAKALNCTARNGADPCNACEVCVAADEGRLLDLIEIDAASNRGIDNMRDIRAQVAYAPSTAKHKVYIIDEAHMLSKEASNAFLKTLEEPPPFVVFILATTEVHKILPTIVSRCQRFDFRKLDFASSLTRLREVASREGVAIDDEALSFIVSRGDGSLRDMLGLVEQVASYRTGGAAIDRSACLSALGMIGDEAVFELIDAAQSADAGRVVSLLQTFSSQGVDASVLTTQLTEHVRRLLWISSGNEALVAAAVSPEWLAQAKDQGARLSVLGAIALLERLSEAGAALRSATLPYFVLELALLRTASPDLSARVAALERRIEGGAVAAAPAPAATAPAPAPAFARPAPPAPVASAPAPAAAPPAPPAPAPVAAPAPAAAPASTASSEPPWAKRARGGKAAEKSAEPPAAEKPAPEKPAPPAKAAPAPERPAAAAPPPPPLPESDPEPISVATSDDDESLDAPADSTPAPAADDLKAAWERVMARMKADSPRLAGILREVLAFQRTGKTFKIFIRKGHSFAMDTLKKEPPQLMTALEAEMGGKMSLVVAEDATAQAVTPDAEPPPTADRGWIEKKAVKSKTVQNVVKELDGEIIRVD
jgi:DNA polymerase-3 subunit gamma/tau